MKNIIIVFILISHLFCDKIESKSGSVEMTLTLNLLWQDNKEVKLNKFTWIEANKYCNELSFLNRKDWHLPSIYELDLITKQNKNVYIDKNFKNVKINFYWSSNESIENNKLAYFMNIVDGKAYAYNKDSEYYVRCVAYGF